MARAVTHALSAMGQARSGTQSLIRSPRARLAMDVRDEAGSKSQIRRLTMTERTIKVVKLMRTGKFGIDRTKPENLDLKILSVQLKKLENNEGDSTSLDVLEKFAKKYNLPMTISPKW